MDEKTCALCFCSDEKVVKNRGGMDFHRGCFLMLFGNRFQKFVQNSIVRFDWFKLYLRVKFSEK